MVELGKYATEVLLAYGVSLTIILALVFASLASAKRAKRILEAAEQAMRDKSRR